MEKIQFYSKLTPEILENCGYQSDKYAFTFQYQGVTYDLKQKGSSIIKLSDPNDIWKVEDEGISLEKTVRIAYPNLLFGKDGVACHGAEIGICIIWTNKTLTQTGIILPISDITTGAGRTCKFSFRFNRGELSGDLELVLSMYIKKRADTVPEGEDVLINEEGVSVGEIETVVLDFNSTYMEFPIEEYRSEKEPLWWVEFSQWEDPKVDLFSKENLCLYLNPHYDSCPMVGEHIKNLDLLIDILSSTYALIFFRLSDEDLTATCSDVGLENNSICSILHQFIESCTYPLRFNPPEVLIKTLQLNIREMLKEDEEE